MITAPLSVLLAVVILTGCGGGSDATTAPHATKPATKPGNNLQINMGDYYFSPRDANSKAGSVTISAPNSGQLPHEPVLARTNADPSKLPTTSTGLVDEAKLDSPGEIAEVAPGETKETTLKLTPGKYVMFCNLPGHYAQGMYGSLIVK